MAVLTGFAQRGLMYLLLLELGIVSIAWNLIAWVLDRIVRPRHGPALGRAAISRIYGTVWRIAEACGMMRIEAPGLEALARDKAGIIVAANHPTLFDALILVSRLPRGVCIMKAELMHNIFLGAGARLARYICNDSPRGLVRCAVNCLREGCQLLMFPEGTRSVAAPVNAFRPGITLIAKLADVPIQTVIIETDSPYLRKGWPIWRAPAFPIVVRLRLGERFAPEADCNALLGKLERYFAAELAPPLAP